MSLIEENNNSGKRIWIEVIIALAVPKTYTYSVPPELADDIKPGCRVEVIFGKSKRYAGIVKKIVERPGFDTKDIVNIIDKEPVIFQQQLNFWNWMSRYYMCNEGEIMIAGLPAHLKLSSESIVQFNEEYGDDFSDLDDEEYLVAEALSLKKELRISEVKGISNRVNVYPVLNRMVYKGVCFIFETLNDSYKPKKEYFVSLCPKYNNEDELGLLIPKLERAPKQLELLLAYLHYSRIEGEVKQKTLLKKAGASHAQMRALVDKGILISEYRAVDRIPFLPKINQIDFKLNEGQLAAYNEVRNGLKSKNVCLLHGVTGSGKTMIYMKMIEQIILKNKQALYLLPEISLTTQIIRKLQRCFGGNVAIYHSKFNNKERVEIWNKVKNNEVSVVIGARSALFLPFRHLDLIIVDEEQDSSYKQQDPAPRYQARDSAIYYAGLFGAKVLLGTATPSMESYYHTQTGKYHLVTLDKRFGDAQLPEIEIVDLKKIPSKKKIIISPQLEEAVNKMLEQRKQVILFKNRRGYSPMTICGSCGFIPRCTDCDVSLTLHKSSNKLHCHYCGKVYSRLIKCPACGSTNWVEKNFGTEKLEEELTELFPKAKVGRMDVDSIRGKYAHDDLIQLFERGKIDILAGTQMVVKGLDFENVMLIGVLDADGLLSFSNFRVYERAFQLMEQVSGRAGRKEGIGKVLIQAMQTDSPVLKWVKNHDFDGFYRTEIEARKQFFYPPYSRLLKIDLKHKQKDVVVAAAHELAMKLESHFEFITGPAEPVIGRIRNKYLMNILLKLHPDRKRLEVQKEMILNYIALLKSDKRFKSVVVVPDVDPA